MNRENKLLIAEDPPKQHKTQNTFAYHYITKNLRKGRAISIPSLDILITSNMKIRKRSIGIQNRNLRLKNLKPVVRILKSRQPGYLRHKSVR